MTHTGDSITPPPPPQQGRHEDRPWEPQAQGKGTSGQSQSITTGAGATAVFPGRSTLPATPPGRALGLGPQDCDVPGSEVQPPGSSPGPAGPQRLLRLGHPDPVRSQTPSAPPAALLHLRRLLQQHRLLAPVSTGLPLWLQSLKCELKPSSAGVRVARLWGGPVLFGPRDCRHLVWGPQEARLAFSSQPL